MVLDSRSLWEQAWVGSPAQYVYAAVFVGAVVCMIGWASWCFWVQREERRMLSDVLAMMRRDASDAAAVPPGGHARR